MEAKMRCVGGSDGARSGGGDCAQCCACGTAAAVATVRGEVAAAATIAYGQERRG